MKTKRFNPSHPLLNWVLRRGRDVLAFQVYQDRTGYEVAVSAPGRPTQLYSRLCAEGRNALQLHAALVADFRDDGWTSIAYR